MPNEKDVVVAALRRALPRCEYLDEANALRVLADRVEGDQEYGELADQLETVRGERDTARKARDDAHAQADAAMLRLQEMQTVAEGYRAERDTARFDLENATRELRSLRARVVLQQQPADPDAPTGELPAPTPNGDPQPG